jgi:hypothetical protein
VREWRQFPKERPERSKVRTEKRTSASSSQDNSYTEQKQIISIPEFQTLLLIASCGPSNGGCHWTKSHRVMVVHADQLCVNVRNCQIISLKMILQVTLWTTFLTFPQGLGCTVRGTNPLGGEIFYICPDWPWGPPSLPYKWYRVSCPWIKLPGRGVNHTTPSSAEVKEREDLYIYCPSGYSWLILGRNLPYFTF